MQNSLFYGKINMEFYILAGQEELRKGEAQPNLSIFKKFTKLVKLGPIFIWCRLHNRRFGQNNRWWGEGWVEWLKRLHNFWVLWNTDLHNDHLKEKRFNLIGILLLIQPFSYRILEKMFETGNQLQGKGPGVPIT